MESIFKISRLGEFGLLIEGLESDAGQYLSDDNVSVSHRSYKWGHSVTINTLSTLNSEGTETFDSYHIVDHLECCDDRQEVQLEKDGLYRVAHIILPTRAWIDNAIAVGDTFNLYDKVYFYDNGKFYLHESESDTEVEFSEIYNTLPADENTIIRSDKNTFAMYYLNNCFNSLLKEILKALPKADNKCYSDEYKNKLFNRDLLWMFINVIKYSLDQGKLYEAQRFLEKLNRCNVICGTPKLGPNGCGC